MAILNTRGNASAAGFGFTSGGPNIILLSSNPGPAATITTYSGYIVFRFTASATLNVGAGVPGTADVFVVAGGSNGQSSDPALMIAGTGGAGGRTKANPGFSISANSPIPVVVGGSGTDSTFGPVTSSGGSSGGTPGPTGGTVGGNGGAGPTNSYLTGSPQNYSGGGGGGAFSASRPPAFGAYLGGTGGATGGGPGGSGRLQRPLPLPGPGATPATPGSNGTANTGGGGGGGGNNDSLPTQPGGNGGSGVVIVRFPDTQFRTS